MLEVDNKIIEDSIHNIDFALHHLSDCNKEIYQSLLKAVNEYLGQASIKSEDENTTFLKCLEGRIEGKWVFDNLDILFHSDICSDYKPTYAVSHYRGLLFTNNKESSTFSPKDESKKDIYNKFLDNYELVHGDGRHTLNTLLAYYIEKISEKKRLFFCGCFSDQSKLEYSDDWLKLKISPDIKNILLGTDDYSDQILDLRKDKTEIERLKNKLEEHRNRALYCALCGYNEVDEDLRTLLSDFSELIFNFKESEEINYNEEDTSNIKIKKREIWLEILQVLQGICIFLIYFDKSLFVLLSKQIEIKSRSSCIGEFFIFSNDCESDSFQNFIKRVFPIVDNIQRYYFDRVLKKIPKRNKEAIISLGYALQSPRFAENIATGVGDKVFNFDSLAGVIRLSQVISPSAIHEGKPLNISFIVGYPSLIKQKVSSICEFKNEEEEESKVIDWHVPSQENGSDENAALHEAMSRIIGNCLLLQKDNIALFVDCNEKKPTIHNIVEPLKLIAPGVYNSKSNLIEITSDVDEAFLVKIMGQKKIEIFYRGKKILVYGHNATWEEETSWDNDSILDFLCQSLSVDKDNKAVKTISETAYSISQTKGEGASFVILKNDLANKDIMAPSMTIPFPNLGKGDINEVNLRAVAIEDGGVLIDVSGNKFYGRRQWLPYQENGTGIPFWYNSFTIPSDEWEWDKITNKSKLKYPNAGELTVIDTSTTNNDLLVFVKTPPRLYDICKYEYIINDNKTIKNPWYWDSWYKILSWGTRHLSSMGMSACLWDKTVVIVISADSTIAVFYEGIEQVPIEAKLGKLKDEKNKNK